MNPVPQLVSLVAPGSMEADQYRGLRHTVEQLRRDGGHQVFAITSAGVGDGKSITTLNLAAALAQSRDTRVLVIDADLHRPSIATYLGIDVAGAPGLAGAIEQESRSLASVAANVGELDFAVVPAGASSTGAYELLNSPRLHALVAEARNSFDYILVDTPPLLPLPDCRVIARWVDGFLIVVTAHRTPRRALADALDLLPPAQVFGLVFNGDDRPLSPGAGYYSYYAASVTPSRPNDARSFRRAILK
jgi:capsular exopolysaccharide synthesis family protein